MAAAGTVRQGREATAKRYTLGTHRARDPAATWAWLVPLFPKVGITRVADVTRLDRLGVPVWQAIRPRSRNITVSQGKGLTPEAAKVSAAMEAVELWHAERLDHLPQTVRTLRQMAGHNPIPETSLRWIVDAPRLADWLLPWLRLRSLTRDRPGWLPRDMVEIDYRLSPTLRPQSFLRTSNGLASGNTPEEALLHALCELIERHAMTLAHRQPARRQRLDEATLTCAHARALIDQLRAAGSQLALYDLTWEAGVTVLQVELVSDDLPVVWRGSGCHPDPAVAAARALTEACQSRLTFISGARDDLPPLAGGQHPARVYKAFDPPTASRAFTALPNLASDDLATDVERVITRLEALGFEPFLLDLTRPELGVPVALTFVPGLYDPPHG